MDVDMNSIVGVPTWDYFNSFPANPSVILILIVIIIVYFILFYSLGSSSNVNQEITPVARKNYGMLGILLWSLFIILIIFNGMNYLFNIDIVTSIKNIFTSEPEIVVKVNELEDPNEKIKGTTTVPELKFTKQVYNIPGNKYTFEDAKAICKAYGNRLASYKEINDAYEKGAEWCNYGWSKDQMAFFPTQYSTWDKLQKIEGHENDCGRPGINGGYIANPNVKFGINCFGYKPKITNQEAELMQNTQLYPKTQKEIDFNKKVDYWKNQISDIVVSPFNHNNWSSI